MRRVLLLMPLLLLSACSVIGSITTAELLGSAAGPLTSAALGRAPGQASNTVHHGDAPVKAVCIEFNRSAPLADLVPALQAELRSQQVSSRVYEAGTELQGCPVWLRYAASIEWGKPPFSDNYRPYLSAATLSLRRADGVVMATSDYRLDEEMGVSRWADTRRKLSRTVYALLTGFEN
ncbi:hypothetical protein [Pelomonas sp. KK5]|uniref:hypothetical protein n=1 Tax=Pelomonas sp. KK5 TaxID=1855730 RepID=UPI00097BED42|nr:hypothetical protein [Pelomonas sp. KK5]